MRGIYLEKRGGAFRQPVFPDLTQTHRAVQVLAQVLNNYVQMSISFCMSNLFMTKISFKAAIIPLYPRDSRARDEYRKPNLCHSCWRSPDPE